MLPGREAGRLTAERNGRDRLAAARESTVEADPGGGPAGGDGCGAEQEAPPAQHEPPLSAGCQGVHDGGAQWNVRFTRWGWSHTF